MALATFAELMDDARRGSYAVGYFESWNLETLLAVADAAEARRSPVILGFSGVHLPTTRVGGPEHLGDYAALGLEVCRRLNVPAALLFNESPDVEWVLEAVDLGFQLVMYAVDDAAPDAQAENTRRVVRTAHAKSVAVEAELASPPGLDGTNTESVGEVDLTDCDEAAQFVADTGIDAFAVGIGQEHLHGRAVSRLNFDHLDALHDALGVPLVLHGASSVPPEELTEAVARGIRKINVGSVLKQAWFERQKESCLAVPDGYNPYEVMGSGMAADIAVPARQAVQAEVERLMDVFGSSGKA
jgi:fructose/tagatose bisphosphate aldolase